MNLGESVKKLRTDKGMTQEELAEAVGVQTSMIGHIERGMKIPSLAVALKLGDVLGCTVDEMCQGLYTERYTQTTLKSAMQYLIEHNALTIKDDKVVFIPENVPEEAYQVFNLKRKMIERIKNTYERM